jgi:hypothetical protein
MAASPFRGNDPVISDAMSERFEFIWLELIVVPLVNE